MTNRDTLDRDLYYGIGDQEDLSPDLDNCMADYVDEFRGNAWDIERIWGYFGIGTAPLPETVEVLIYKHVDPAINVDHLLEHVLETLDDAYANPEGDSTDSTDAMRKATEEYVATMLREYAAAGSIWWCRRVGSEIVSTKEYDN